MSNPFQDQLLKAGLVTKQQVLKAKSDKNKQHKQQRSTNAASVDETKLQAEKIAEEKANQARELNRKKEDQLRQKAMAAEISQLITTHRIKRDVGCEIAYNFEHDKIIKSMYINAELRQQIIQGKIGIVSLDGGYELVSKSIVEKIKQRNERCIVVFNHEQNIVDANDPYAKYQVPDDLMW